MSNLIIVPTYNEARNVPILIEAIIKILPETHILFVDDASPDGTGHLIEALRQEQSSQVSPDREGFGQARPKLFVLHRSSKRGIASAYIDGFRWALERSYDVICQMDADLSHDPVVLPGMLEKMVDHDLVIGSRYVGGGGIQNWGLLRRGLSLCANLYSRMVLQCPIHDLTSGFVLWRRAALEVLDLEAIRSKGYVFQIELKLRAHRRRFTFSEIPIVFEERKLGRSKLNLAIIWEAFVRVLRLRSLL